MSDIWYRITYHEALQCEHVKALLETPQKLIPWVYEVNI